MEEHWLSDLVDAMSQYDITDVLAKIGGLLIFPENASRIGRLEIAAHAAAAVTPVPTTRRVPASALRSLLNNSVISEEWFVMQEDPLGGWLTESVTYAGGPNIVFPGIVSNATFILRHVLKAITLHKRPFSSPDFAPRCGRLAFAALRLSNAIAARAGMARGVLPIERRRDKSILIPPDPQLDALSAAVTFSESELREVCGSHVDPDALSPLVINAGSVALSKCTPDSGPIQARPIVRCGDTFVVVAPTLLTAALRHAIVCQAQEAGLLNELAERLNGAFWLTLKQSLTHMGLSASEGAWPGERPDLLLADGLFGFDTDKALYACLLTDDLVGYDQSTVFGEKAPVDVWHSIRTLFEHVQADLRKLPQPPAELVCLLLTAGIGRAWVVGASEKGEDLPYELLTLGLAELETISLLEGHDELFLWRFARDSRRARDKFDVFSFATLNEYGFYRQREYSFYFSDDATGGHLALDVSWEGDLHREVMETVDPHGVPSWDRRHIAEVVTAHGTRDVPVYMQRKAPDDRVALVVEGYSVPIWVIGVSPLDEGQRSDYATIAMLADAIAYWLWQFTPSMCDWFNRAFGDAPDVVVICLKAGESLELHSDELPAQAHARAFELAPRGADLELSVVFRAAVNALIDGPTNTGEKVLMQSLLAALRDMAPAPARAAMPDSEMAEIIDRHCQPATKKKMLVMRADAEPMIDRRGVPPGRKVSPSDENVLLDDLGEYLRIEKGMSEGRVPDHDRVPLLNTVVDFYFDRLNEMLSALRADGLLEWLVRQHEAILRESAFWKLVLPSRLACYETESSLAERWTKEHSGFAKAALGARFVIEVVIATPPSGARPISYSTYDEVVAVAGEIITRGFDSDVIHYELEDAKLSILKSGRLGRAFDEYDKSRRAFMAAFSAADVTAAQARFDQYWERDDGNTETDLSEVEAAAREEFGHPLTDIGKHWKTVSALAAEKSPGVMRMPKAELAALLATRLSWSVDRTTDIIDRFSLTPRTSFLDPPVPYRRQDVYPWRFTRQYSYIRRPFLVIAHGGCEDIIVGPRHLHQAWRYLVHLCMDGRLQPTSKRMQRFIGELNKRRGEAFNDSVADRIVKTSKLRVRRRVKKVKSAGRTIRLPGNSDIDVLVLQRARRTIWLIECKDLALARTPREMAQELAAVFKGRGHSRSTVEKHIERAEWTRKHLRDLLASEGLGWSDKWKVRPIIVLEHRPASAYLFKPPVPVLALDELLARLG